MNGKKAILLGPAHPYRGGIAAFNHQLASIMQSNGWSVELETFKFQYPNILFPGKDQLTKDRAPEHLKIARNLHTLNPINWFFESKKIASRNPDLVIGQYWMPYIGLSLSQYLKRIKVHKPEIKTATIVHNLIPHEKKPGDAYFTQMMLRNSDAFVSLSKEVSNDIYSKKRDAEVLQLFHPIYNNYGDIIDEKRAKAELGLSESEDYILFFGLVRAYKGLDLLIKAFAKANLEGKTLLIVGEFYEDERVYKDMIAQLGIKAQVIIRPEFVPDGDVKLYFSACSLVALPYKTATQSGITQIALHFEKPIIATNVGGLHEVVKHDQNGYLVAAHSDAIAQALSRFYLERKEKEFSQSSKKLKEALSWQKFYDLLMEGLEF